MLAYVPAILVLPRRRKNVDARDKPGHDDFPVETQTDAGPEARPSLASFL